MADLRTRLLARLDVDLDGPQPIDEAPCWNWTGARTTNGYGRIGIGRRHQGTALAHRVMYREWFGSIPAGLDVDHVCRNKLCCNPAHLEPVTRSENMRRWHAGRRDG